MIERGSTSCCCECSGRSSHLSFRRGRGLLVFVRLLRFRLYLTLVLSIYRLPLFLPSRLAPRPPLLGRLHLLSHRSARLMIVSQLGLGDPPASILLLYLHSEWAEALRVVAIAVVGEEAKEKGRGRGSSAFVAVDGEATLRAAGIKDDEKIVNRGEGVGGGGEGERSDLTRRDWVSKR